MLLHTYSLCNQILLAQLKKCFNHRMDIVFVRNQNHRQDTRLTQRSFFFSFFLHFGRNTHHVTFPGLFQVTCIDPILLRRTHKSMMGKINMVCLWNERASANVAMNRQEPPCCLKSIQLPEQLTLLLFQSNEICSISQYNQITTHGSYMCFARLVFHIFAVDSRGLKLRKWQLSS